MKLCVWEPCTRVARRKFCSDRHAQLWWRDQSRRCGLCRVCRTAPRARGDQCEACYQRKRLVDASEAAELAALKATNPARCPRCRIVSEGVCDWCKGDLLRILSRRGLFPDDGE